MQLGQDKDEAGAAAYAVVVLYGGSEEMAREGKREARGGQERVRAGQIYEDRKDDIKDDARASLVAVRRLVRRLILPHARLRSSLTRGSYCSCGSYAVRPWTPRRPTRRAPKRGCSPRS